MPTDAEHQAKVQHNTATLAANGGLVATSECWAAVVAFYTALHLVERLAAQNGIHHTRHNGMGSRRMYLASHAAHNQILADYMALQSASELARYHSMAAFQAAYPTGATQTQLITGCLGRIEQYVTNFSTRLRHHLRKPVRLAASSARPCRKPLFGLRDPFAQDRSLLTRLRHLSSRFQEPHTPLPLRRRQARLSPCPLTAPRLLS
jgi:hypothetical protein